MLPSPLSTDSCPTRNHADCSRKTLRRAHRQRTLTGNREAVLRVLLSTHQALGAYDILDRLASPEPSRSEESPSADPISTSPRQRLDDDIRDQGPEPAPKPRRLAPTQVYRALNFLVSENLAHYIASCKAYAACYYNDEDPGQCHDRKSLALEAQDETIHRNALLICERCKSVQEIFAPELHQAVHRLATAHQLELESESSQPRCHLPEIVGRCSTCLEKGHDEHTD